MTVARRARSDASTKSSSIPVTHTNHQFTLTQQDNSTGLVDPHDLDKQKFYAKLDRVRIFLSKEYCVCKLLYFVILPAIYVFSRGSTRVSDCMCIRTDVFRRLFVS